MADLILKHKTFLAILMLLLVTGSLLMIKRINIDVNFSDFFPDDDPDMEFFKIYEEALGKDDLYIMIAFEPEEQLFDSSFLQRVDSFVKICRNLKFVERVYSITDLNQIIKSPLGFSSIPFIHLDNPTRFKSDSIRIRNNFLLTQNFVSSEITSLVLLMRIEEKQTHMRLDSVFSELDGIIRDAGVPQVHIMGRKYLEYQYQELVRQELSSSIIIAVSVILIVLGIQFRSARRIIIPLVTMLCSMILLFGYISLTGRNLGIMSNLFPTIIMIIGVSNCIHLLSKYNHELALGTSPNESLKNTIRELGLTLFLTSITTAIGFLTLLTSSMKALRDFGLEAAAGVMIAYVVAIIGVPVLLAISNKILPSRTTFIWNMNFINSINDFTKIRGSSVLLGTVIFIIISAVGFTMINFNNLQLTNIPDDSRLKNDYLYFDKNLGGSRIFEIAVTTVDTLKISHLIVLKQIRKIHKYLEQHPSFTSISSPASYYHTISRIFQPQYEYLQLPESDVKLNSYLRETRSIQRNEFYSIVDSTMRMGRITARVHDIGRIEVNKLSSELSGWISHNINDQYLKINFTGADLLIDKGHELRIRNMFYGLLIAIISVAIIIGMFYGNIRILIITLIVNTIPLILVAGLVGFLGIEFRGTTSILFTLGFVVAVDDTIHFLAKYKFERNNGRSMDEAINITFKETGTAIFMTSITLSLGFGALIHSDSWDVYILGLLVSIMILVALLIDLFLTPVLLRKYLAEH